MLKPKQGGHMQKTFVDDGCLMNITNINKKSDGRICMKYKQEGCETNMEATMYEDTFKKRFPSIKLS